MNANYILNVKQSPFDGRDYIYSSSDNIELPKVLDYRKDLMPVRNQGSQGTCYAQSAACMKEWQEKKDYGFNEYFSPQFFYNNRDYWNNTIQDGKDENEDYGMTGRDVMKILKTVGICKETDYPYGLLEKASDISDTIKSSAKQHCIKKYARITDLENLKKSLYCNGPCLIAFPVYNHGSEMWKPKNDEKMSGGHAMTVVGYNEEGFIIRNSWGWFWNYGGYCIYKYSDWGCHWEIWTTIDENTQTTKDDELTEPEPEQEFEPEEHSNCLKKLIKRMLGQN